MTLIESEADENIKRDLYHFLNEDYLGRFTKEENDFALKLSFLFNHSEVINDHLVFRWGNQVIKIKIDEQMPNCREAHFSFIMRDDFFNSSLKAFIRENKINKILND